MADSLYRVILGRRPTKAENFSAAVKIGIPSMFEARISEMLNSREFQIMKLPGLIANATQDWGGKHVFFLHIPKSAGTSVRLALIDALGIPAFDVYSRNEQMREIARNSDNKFWPLYVGHENISFFPESYSGITVFRESRSRVLSLYRQNSRDAIIDDPSEIDQAVFQEMRRKALKVFSTPFGDWLIRPNLVTSMEFFIPSKMFGPKGLKSQEFKTYVDDLESQRVEELLNESLTRFSHAAWSHDEPAILKAISGISEREITELPHENIYLNLEGYPPQILDKHTLAKLNSIQEKEAVLFKVAHEHGLVPLLSKSEADDLFKITAKRLGFTFA